MPKAAPMDNRFMTAAVRGMTKLRNTVMNKRKDRRTTSPIKRGSLDESTFEKSMKIAVVPPTRTFTPELETAWGGVSDRRWFTRSVVARPCGADLGKTFS